LLFLFEDLHERRSRVLRIHIDLAVLEGLVGYRRGAEVQLLLHVETLGLERLGVEFAQDVLLGEVLRAYGDRRTAPAAIFGAGPRAAAAADVAACGEQGQRERRE
jgi:hypothetical protein